MSSKRYQIKRVPECPYCGETKFIQKADGINGIKTHFCYICDKSFWWSEREPKPTNTEIDYKASYSMLRFRWRFLFGEKPLNLNIVPAFVGLNPIWKAAEISMAHRFDYNVKTSKCTYKKLQTVKNECGYGMVWYSEIQNCINLGKVNWRAYRKWKDKIDLDKIPF